MEKTKIIDKQLLDELSSKAATSERKRANYNLHERAEDKVQRFFNAMEPGTYVQPHRHHGEDKWELFIVLRGTLLALIFDEQGRILSRNTLTAGEDIGVEVPADTWHTLVSMESGTIMFEGKRGPYTPTTAKDFASWAPIENDPTVAKYIEWFINGEIGSLPPKHN